MSGSPDVICSMECAPGPLNPGVMCALALRLDNNLALHAFVSKTAGMAALKRVRSWCFGKELDRGRFSLL